MSSTYSVPRAVQGDAPELLRAWRSVRMLTQAELAALLRCSQATVSEIERGAVYPPESVRKIVARRCKIPARAWGERPNRRRAVHAAGAR